MEHCNWNCRLGIRTLRCHHHGWGMDSRLCKKEKTGSKKRKPKTKGPTTTKDSTSLYREYYIPRPSHQCKLDLSHSIIKYRKIWRGVESLLKPCHANIMPSISPLLIIHRHIPRMHKRTALTDLTTPRFLIKLVHMLTGIYVELTQCTIHILFCTWVSNWLSNVIWSWCFNTTFCLSFLSFARIIPITLSTLTRRRRRRRRPSLSWLRWLRGWLLELR